MGRVRVDGRLGQLSVAGAAIFSVSVFAALLALALAACGSKSGLTVPNADPGDGAVVPPVVDSGVDATLPPPPFDLCVELPPEEPPSEITVAFESRILTADVLFLIDTTGSMVEEIGQIRAALRDRIVPALLSTIGDVHLSVASLADFPVGSYGGADDMPFVLLSESTGDVGAIEAALDRLPVSSGADVPESQTEALYQAATGAGFGRTVRPARCPEGTVGYPCFRADGSRIILLFTDAEFHNGPGDSNLYGREVMPTPHTYAETVAELRGVGAKVLGLFSGTVPEALRDLEAVARDTGAVTPAGVPIVVNIGEDGRMLDDGVAESVRTLVEEVPLDIDILAEDLLDDGVDALEFVRGLEAVSAIPRDGAIVRSDRFDQVRPGTRVTFRVLLHNDRFPRGPEPLEYYLRIVLRGDGVTRLQTTDVKIVIPSEDGGGC